MAGETVTAALLNTHLRDNLKAIGDPWGSFTPTWTASSVNPALGNGTLAGFFTIAGKLVFYSISLTMGSTTTYGTGAYMFALPGSAPAKRQVSCGDTRLLDASGSSNLSGSAFVEPGLTTMRPLHSTGSVTGTSPFTFAQNDIIMVAGAYEAA